LGDSRLAFMASCQRIRVGWRSPVEIANDFTGIFLDGVESG
jgi:hypothetical protein